MAVQELHWLDYTLFALSLVIPLAIGIFFFLYGGRQRTTKEYLFGDENMNGVVVGFSMMVSTFSAIALISSPAETYYYGAIWTLVSFPFIFNIFLNGVFLVPFFRRFHFKSGYKYFEVRYQNSICRIIVAIAYTLMRTLTLGTAIYAPSVVFNQVTGLSVNIAIIVCGTVCVAYTFLGGLKAVLYTDAVQALIMLGGYVALVVIGTDKAGGIDHVWETAEKGGRFNFDTFSLDLRVRHTNFNLVLGGFIATWAFYDQITLQRIYAAKSTSAANVGMFVSVIVGVINTIMVTLAGLVLYAYYEDCDPIFNPLLPDVEKADQIVAHFAMEIFQDYPGVSGIFLASLFAAALSTVSSMMNALALTFVEDFIKPGYLRFKQKKMTERENLICAKVLCLIFGVVCIGVSYLTPHIGPLLVTSVTTITAAIGSPIAALFIISIFVPWTNNIGAITGFVCGEIIGLSLAVTGIVNGIDAPILDIGYCGLVPPYPDTNSSMETTTADSSMTMAIAHMRYRRDAEELEDFYADRPEYYYADISYAWYGCFSMSTTIVVGIAVSLLTNWTRFRQNIDYLLDNSLLIYKNNVEVEDEFNYEKSIPEDKLNQMDEKTYL